ncbi:M4 family metallopeptidase [Amnibacterium kyonggiense]|uniref:Neutral metalloproteinase n=1 Tax=Amnibacterium kyonggiense TaxID=595671 RepID=A0A4R7FFB6_9MICO|nr:M4 family metallopeptidase [Amnibacterium kyonggiense]TDS74871.1 thermolysin metallopeptidase-like protein [Amnibacterium kyonggiense]
MHCTLVPPYILQALARHQDPVVRDAAIATLGYDKTFAVSRLIGDRDIRAAVVTGRAPRLHRLIHDAQHEEDLPGALVRSEGEAPSTDVAVNEAYDGLGDTWKLYEDVFQRNSIDDAGMDLSGTVHFSQQYDNAYWDGQQMVFGDGDGVLFNRFTISVDVIGHELTHGVTGATADLAYKNQSGALNESISDVFGSLVKQYALGQSAEEADWLIGAGLLAEDVHGVALRSMKAPGTAYDDDRLGGKDPQPAHIRDYLRTTSDNGGVHTNSGIPNHAFYLAAVGLGGNAWEQAGHVWYDALTGGELQPTATFPQFAQLTVATADRLYGAAAKKAVAEAWTGVGIVTS